MLKIIPNLLTSLRLLSASFMLLSAIMGNKNIFIILLIFAIITDSLDGFLARTFNSTSDLGAKLDSIADFSVALLMPICLWQLFPAILEREAVYISIILIGWLLHITIALCKFKTIPSYHTKIAKTATIIISISFVTLLLFPDIYWPFRISSLWHTVAAIEGILITLKISKSQSNVPSFSGILKNIPPGE